MVSMFYAVIMVLLWIVNLFNGTGLDSVYHVTQNARLIVIILSIGVFLLKGNSHVASRDFFTFGLMIVSFCISSFMKGYGSQPIEYLWVFGLVYLLGHLELDEKAFFWTGLAYGVGGLFILFIYDYGTVLHGWNSNSIAMIGMYSFLIMLIPFFNKTSFRSKSLILITAIAFAYLINPTSSRSCILFSMIGALFAINAIPRKLIYGRSGRMTICLVFPLIIAIIVVLVSGTSLFESLNLWSYLRFGKPIFNGRDEFWRYGFEVLFDNFLIGAGTMNINNWHNSAMTCLSAYGTVGYFLWISSFKNILNQASWWLDDYIVQGCVVSFIVIYVQQSVELGFISANPNLIAYVILGMMLGRIRYLRNEEYENA